MNFMRRMMIGRYGGDQLGMALIIAGLVVNLVTMAFPNSTVGLVLRGVSMALLVLEILRMFSRNIARRQKENYAFLKIWNPVRNAFRPRADAKTHMRFKCKKCKQELRVPRGKGKICVTCPKCGEKVIKKT